MASVHRISTPPREQWEINHDEAVEALIPFVRKHYNHQSKFGFGQLEEEDIWKLADHIVYMTEEEQSDFLHGLSTSEHNTFFK